MRTTPLFLFLALAATLMAAPVLAQGAGPVKVPVPAASPSAAPAPAEFDPTAVLDPEETKSILVEGEILYRHIAERDPFSPLVSAKSSKESGVRTRFKTTGIGRFTVEACNLSAIVKTAKGEVAYFAGPDGKAYKVATGDEFADGKVTSISYDLGRVVIQQELINDTTQVKPFRDLVLVVRSQGGESK